VALEAEGSNPFSHPRHSPVSDPDRDETRPIRCVACGRDFASPRWFAGHGPLCLTCYERMRREEDVRHVRSEPDGGSLRGWLRRLLGG
jgi:hypothetical protein